MTVQPTRDQLRALADKATPGPWTVGHLSHWDFDGRQVPQSSVRRPDRVAITWDDHGGDVFVPADAEFIAAARTALPALLDALDQAEAERDAARGYISELETAVQSRNDVIKHRDTRIKAVRDLHVPDRPLDKYPDCVECTINGYCEDDTPIEWPCPTIRALDGDQ